MKVTMPAEVLAPIEVQLKYRGILQQQVVAYPLKFHQDLVRRMLEYGVKVWLQDLNAIGVDPGKMLKRAHTGKSHWSIAPQGKRGRKEMYITKTKRGSK